jgi:hypothetical protein
MMRLHYSVREHITLKRLEGGGRERKKTPGTCEHRVYKYTPYAGGYPSPTVSEQW